MARTDLRISDEILEQIKKQAVLNNRSLNGELVQLIQQGLSMKTLYKLPNGQIVENLYNQSKSNGSTKLPSLSPEEAKEATPSYHPERIVWFPDYDNRGGGSYPP